ncbi:MAG: hypothetical protein AMS14_11710 [Planctomycetes bacterium DG_20]|nr:MAG: hypothetical protein AMS14_11710 [Planctomycetes bacterium DG_20]
MAAGCGRPPDDERGEPGALGLFNGRNLAGWTVLEEGFFDKAGKVYAAGGALHLEAGSDQTGIAWAGEFPTTNYEVELQAMRAGGRDFFCGMTFPVGASHCTWIVGGWGGTVVGLSNVDGYNAAENATTRTVTFESNRWYRLRLRVTDERIEAFIDGRGVIDQQRDGHAFGLWLEVEPCRPFGMATWRTSGALRDITLRRLGPDE